MTQVRFRRERYSTCVRPGVTAPGIHLGLKAYASQYSARPQDRRVARASPRRLCIRSRGLAFPDQRPLEGRAHRPGWATGSLFERSWPPVGRRRRTLRQQMSRTAIGKDLRGTGRIPTLQERSRKSLRQNDRLNPHTAVSPRTTAPAALWLIADARSKGSRRLAAAVRLRPTE